MRIDILTVLPEMIEGFFDCSIMARAKKKGLADIVIHNIRDYTTDKHHRTDDYPFGGCAGMVMKIEPIDNLITKLKSERHYDEVIFTTPDGEQWNQKMANTMSMCENLIILCGHFKGLPHTRTSDNKGGKHRRLCAHGGRTGCCRDGRQPGTYHPRCHQR